MKRIKMDKKWFGYKTKMYYAIILILCLCFIIFQISNEKIYVSYNEFVKSINLGKINSVELTNNQYFYFKKNEDTKKYYTENPRTENFKESLLSNGIAVTENTNSSAGVLTYFVMGGIVLYVAMNMNKKKGLLKEEVGVDVNADEEISNKNEGFDMVAGNEEAKENLMDVVDFLKNPKKYQKYGARMPKGIIFYGPPGTGKTLLAKAMAKEAKVAFFPVSGSDFVQMYVGVGSSRIRELFKKAKASNKAVIFIDEIDALAKKRGVAKEGGNEERDQTLNALLTEMSGFYDNQGIVVVAATNRLDVLDEAILRPGRFDRRVEVMLPDKSAREKILRLHAKNKIIDEDVDFRSIAEDTVYFSGAMLENLLNEAAIIAAKNNEKTVNRKCIQKAYDVITAGGEKNDRSALKKKDMEITAYHEIGHVIAIKTLKPNNKLSKVTIIPTTKGAGGYTLNIPEDKYHITKNDIINEIMILYAGRAAEEVIYGSENITVGASNDIERATDLIRKMYMKYGMNENIGLVTIDENDEKYLLEEESAIAIELYEKSKKIVANNMKRLIEMVKEILVKETLYENEIDQIMHDRKYE